MAEVCFLLVENYSNSCQVWSSRSFLQFLCGLRPNYHHFSSGPKWFPPIGCHVLEGCYLVLHSLGDTVAILAQGTLQAVAKHASLFVALSSKAQRHTWKGKEAKQNRMCNVDLHECGRSLVCTSGTILAQDHWCSDFWAWLCVVRLTHNLWWLCSGQQHRDVACSTSLKDYLLRGHTEQIITSRIQIESKQPNGLLTTMCNLYLSKPRYKNQRRTCCSLALTTHQSFAFY